MTIACKVCSGTEFKIQEGLHYCMVCLTQSQEHGFETEVDEEAAWLQSRGPHSKRLISSKKRRSKNEHYSSYVSLDAFAFILRGWTDEAEILGILRPTFRPLLCQLFAMYLRKTGRAFMYKKCKPHLGVFPSFRDVQVTLTGRKKLVLRQSKRKRKGSDRKEEDEGEDDELNGDLRKAKRLRSSRRRAFLRSFTSNSSFETDTSFNTSLSDGSILTDSESEVSDKEDDEDEHIFNARNSAMDKLWSSVKDIQNKHVRSVTHNLYHLTLIKAFSIFSMALLLQNGSHVTLSDIVHLVNSGSISLSDALIHLPPTMKTQGTGDLYKYSKSCIKNLYSDLRVNISRISKFIQIGIADFGNPLRVWGNRIKGIPLLDRYILEFALPRSLSKTIRIAFKHTNLLKELKSMGTWNCPDVSLRVLATILVVLKYIYGLDDFTENYIASTNCQKNKGLDPKDQKFIIRDWIRLSRFRVFLMMRCSPWFHRKFFDLIPKTRLTHSSYITDVKEGIDKYRRTRRGGSMPATSSFRRMNQLNEFLLRVYGECIPDSTMLYLGETLTPMHKFSEDVMNRKELGIDSETLSEEARTKIQELMNMSRMKIGMRKLESDPEAIEVDLPIPESSHLSYLFGKGFDSDEAHIETTEFKKLKEFGKIYKFKNKFYRVSAFNSSKTFGMKGCALRPDSMIEKCLAELPDSYTWILKYFSAYIGVCPSFLHGEVSFVEHKLLESKSSFFGQVLETADVSLSSLTGVTQEKVSSVVDDILAKYTVGNEED